MDFYKNLRMVFSYSILLVIYFTPYFVSAHEVYVLDKASIAKDLTSPPLDLFKVAMSNEHLFLVIMFMVILGLLLVLGVSLSRKIEKLIDPILFKIKPYTSHIAQVTLGSALVASAYYGALFGTELPFGLLFGNYAHIVTILLYIAGLALLLGIYPRSGGMIAIAIYLAAIPKEGIYMISYLTYFGEALVVLLFGGGYAMLSIDRPWGYNSTILEIQKFKNFLIRISFSASLIYAAFYAKLIHGALALDTVNKYKLTNYFFHFDPLFIVLGAFIVEMLIAIFYLIGFEIRFTSVFFLIFLTMSLIFFGEAVWPHIILIGTAITLFVHGYDEFTVFRPWYIKDKREPVL